MTKKKTKIVLFCTALCLAGALCLPITGGTAERKAGAATIEEGVLRDTYSFNATFTVPEVTVVTPEGNVLCKKASVIFPDGNCCTDNTLILSQCGTYTIVYDTGKYEVSETFNVYDKNFVVSSSASHAEYVEKFDYERFATYDADGNKIPLRLNNNRGGISVDLAAGDVFTYNVPVNIYEGDNLFNVIKCYPEVTDFTYDGETKTTATSEKTAYVTVKLIDCYNANRYVEFVWWIAPGGKSAWTSAGSDTQDPVGLEYQQYNGYKNSTFNFEDVYYVYHDVNFQQTTQQYGASAGNLNITNDNNAFRRGGMNFQYDPYSQKVYSSYTMAKNSVYDENGYLVEELSYRRLITDLDAPELYTDREKDIFQGFTTGECYLSIQTYKNVSTGLHIDIESIFGRTGEALDNADYVDVTPPKLTFKDGNAYDKPVYAQKDVPVVLPVAEAEDINGNGLYTTTVYANYGTDYQFRVSSENGAFTPVANVTYSAVYRARDNYGNVAEKIINFVVSDKKVISYTENKLSSLAAGVENLLPDIGASSLNGNVSCTVSVKNPAGKTTVVGADGKYLADYLGEYTITYDLTDGIAATQFSYKVNCNDDNAVIFKDKVYTEKYFLKGATYSLADYYAYTVSAQGLQAQLCNVYVSQDGGEYVKLSETQRKAFVPQATQYVDIKMEYGGQYGDVTRVQVVDVGYNVNKMTYENYYRYFLNGNIDEYAYATQETGGWTRIAKANASAFNFVFTGSTKTETIRYANALSLSQFRINFNIPKEKRLTGNYFLANFGKLEIRLIDYYDETNAISFVYEETKKGVTYSVGKYSASVDGVFMKDLDESLFVDGNLIGGKRGKVETPAFKGDLCYLEITLSDITGEAGIAIKSIGNQGFAKSMQPQKSLSVVNNTSGAFGQYAQYEINAAAVTNVLYPVTEGAVTLELLSPGGVSVTAKNGVTLSAAPNGNYTVSLDEIGTYTLTYTVVLPTGKTEIIPFSIAVTDIEAPVITFKDNYNENTLVTVKLGDTHKAQAFTVTDNHSTQEQIKATVIYMTQDGYFVAIGDEEITFRERGYYRVSVIALDAAGNTTTAYYNVLVK